jgi:hypothetical protein
LLFGCPQRVGLNERSGERAFRSPSCLPFTLRDPLMPPLLQVADYVGLLDLLHLGVDPDTLASLRRHCSHVGLDGLPCWAADELLATLACPEEQP